MTASQARSRLVLASGSAARREMMSAAGLVFDVVPAAIDEDGLRETLRSQMPAPSPNEIALALARAKATDVSRARPDDLVIGSDQVLCVGEDLLDKPATVDDVRATLMRLRGTTHALVSAVALAENGQVVWDAIRTARLSMHALSDADLETYLTAQAPAVIGCVGGYQIEGAGVRLFDEIEGDHFTILGMPLVPLLKELRRRQEIAG